MKKLFSAAITFILCMALVLAFVGCSNNGSSSSSDAEVGVIYGIEKDDEGNEYAVVEKYALSEDDAKKVSNNDYADIMVDLEIPAEYTENGKTYPVKEIAVSAFANKLTIRSIKFGSNIETFGSACLAGCSNLESLTVPFVGNTADALNDGKTLGYLFGTAAADGCYSVTMSYNASGSKAYYVPTKLKTVTVTGDKVTDYAFYGLKLETVNLTGNVETIGNYTFYGMNKLMSYKIPATVTAIGNYACAECANLASVDFSAATALATIGEHAFDCCDILGYGKDYVLTMPESVISIGAKAFYNCAELKSVDLTASAVMTLNEYTFYGCAKLASVKLKANTTLNLGVFCACESLTKANVENYATANGTDIAFDIETENA